MLTANNANLRIVRLLTPAAWICLTIVGCQTPTQSGGWTGSVFRPQGEPWTIECVGLAGPGHLENAAAIAEVLRRTDGINANAVRIERADDAAAIHYGIYYRKIDRLRGARPIPPILRADLAMLKSLVDEQGRRLFLAAHMIPIPVPDVGSEQWNLENVVGSYTLQVAAFFASPEIPNRKQAAVDYAAQLRKEGHDAFYHHGNATSIVTVGVFGTEALVRSGGVVRYSDEVRSLQRKAGFAYNVTNGAVWRPIVQGRTGVVKGTVTSQLVKIPKKNANTP